ncbi:hypothetical protein DR64_7088 [Paraburkholderia xenovorans LB400]|nr:hypothetical protein [Paraburkholderia xenovorans]AIP35626.1 hypothetical protein DR64_7088 [Paraburkholderia xenovorans LB400]
MSNLTARIKHEFMEMIPPTLYFLVILHIVAHHARADFPRL